MSDERSTRPSTPHMHMRPATLLTAIGLCLLIMVIQLVPALQGVTSRLTTIATAGAAR